MLGGHKYDQYLLGFSRMTELVGDAEHSKELSDRAEMIELLYKTPCSAFYPEAQPAS